MPGRSLDAIHDQVPHAVLDQPWTYKVVGLLIDFEGDQNNVQLKMTLRKSGETVALLFVGVHELEIEPGFPWCGSGMEILDVSSRGMEKARVRVGSFEQDPAIRFWAQGVERVGA